MDRKTLDELVMDPDVVGSEARSILNNTEDHAELIETTSKAIFRAARRFDAGIHTPDDRLLQAWNDLSARERIRFRQQARAALGASELLDRVRELEQRIDAARRELVMYGGELDGPSLARKVNRVDRILSKPVPDPEPIGVKRKP
jgi:hypothetical protein